MATTRKFTVYLDIYRDRANEWRWRLKASNGRILADSGEGYTRRYSCVKAAARVIALVQAAGPLPSPRQFSVGRNWIPRKARARS